MIDRVETTKHHVNGYEIIARQGAKIDVKDLIRDPEGFHGDTEVDCIVRFGNLKRLVGKCPDEEWQPDTLIDRGIVVMEYYFDEARNIMNGVNALAQLLIADRRRYEDRGLCAAYRDLMVEGYALLRRHEDEFAHVGIPSIQEATIMTLERGGIPCARAARGQALNTTHLAGEVRVVTKRCHLLEEDEQNLSVTVKERDSLAELHGKDVVAADFVDPATGVSVLAPIGVGLTRGVRPRRISHRSIAVARRGVLYVQEQMKAMGMETPTVYALGECDELLPNYYLAGVNRFGEQRAVADAGHVLKPFLPDNYQH